MGKHGTQGLRVAVEETVVAQINIADVTRFLERVVRVVQ